MYNISMEEMMLFAKIFAYAMGDKSISLNQIDKDAAFSVLNRMADQKWNWTEQQKANYKALLEACKPFV